MAGWSGFLAVAIVVIGTLGSIMVSGWSYGVNTVSELGVMGSTATFFNYCLVFGGLLLVIHGAVRGPKEIGVHRISACIIAFAGIFLMLAAAFTYDIDNGNINTNLLKVFCVLMMIAMLVEGYASKNEGLKGILVGGISVITFVVVLVSYFVLDPAKYQILAAVCIMIWMAANSYCYMLSGIHFKGGVDIKERVRA